MKPENAIEVRDITKKFKVYMDKGHTLKELTIFSKRRQYEERQVLRGISFDVKKGEAIGLIGHNGCGKSTTLKLLTKIMYPDAGTIDMCGRVSSLIELGAGFHPDMSGRQNIYTNASIFGLTRKEIDARMKGIISFSELEDFIDNPVRTYSSGMYMRLAFSVAINVDADILLIDEILAVGDANFQSKCFDKLREVKANGTTIVIVSHALGQIEQICEQSYWIEDGYIKMSGIPREVHGEYLAEMGRKRRKQDIKKEKQQNSFEEQMIEEEQDEDTKEIKARTNVVEENNSLLLEKETKGRRFGSGDVMITDITFLQNPDKVIQFGDELKIEIEYKSKVTDIEAVFGYAIYNKEGIKCAGTNVLIESGHGVKVRESGKIIFTLCNNNLVQGDYMLHLAVYTMDNFPIDDFYNAEHFTIISNSYQVGICNLNTKWSEVEK